MLKTHDLPRIFLLSLLLWFSPLLQAEQESAAFTQAAALFAEASFDKTGEAIDLLAASGDSKVVPYLQALLDGKLYQHEEQGTLVIVADGASTDGLRKIPTKNSLRRSLRAAIGQLSLSSPDASVRLTSANGLLETITPDMAPQLRGLLDKETDPAVQEALSLGLAMADLNAAEQPVRLAAIASLAGNLNPGVRNRLTTMTTDSDAAVAKAAQAALKTIEDRAELYGYAETLFFGLSLGSVLVLAAIGLAITFGVMGVINMAHGELIMLGAYTTYIVQQLMPQAIDYSLFVAVPAAFIVSGLMGILIERTVIRHLYGRPLETLLATFGISLILQQLVRTVISPQNVPVSNPSWMSGSLEINSVLSLTYNRLYIVLFCLMVFALLYLVCVNAPSWVCRYGRCRRTGRWHGRWACVRRGGCADLWFGFGHCRCGGCCAQSINQRRAEFGAELHYRLVHGGGVRRGRQFVGNAGGRFVAGRGQQGAGAVGRRGAGEDSGAGVHYFVHPETSTRVVPAERPGGGIGIPKNVGRCTSVPTQNQQVIVDKLPTGQLTSRRSTQKQWCK